MTPARIQKLIEHIQTSDDIAVHINGTYIRMFKNEKAIIIKALKKLVVDNSD